MSEVTETFSSQPIAALGQQMGFSTDGSQFLTFTLGEETYGVEILRVQEIKGYTPVTRIPNTPHFIKGVLNLRGTIVPIIDLRAKFGMEEIEYGKITVIIVLEVKGRTMGIIVDSVSDVMNIPAHDMQASPDFGQSVDTSFLSGIGKAQDRLVSILDIDKVLAVGEFEQASAAAAAAASAKPVQKHGLNVDLLEQSFKAIAPQGPAVVAEFYTRLFARHPEVKTMFQGASMETQQKKLLASLVLVMENLRNPDKLSAALHQLGGRHAGYGAQPAHYDVVAEILVEVLGEFAGPAWTSQTKRAWIDALSAVKSLMLEGARDGKMPAAA